MFSSLSLLSSGVKLYVRMVNVPRHSKEIGWLGFMQGINQGPLEANEQTNKHTNCHFKCATSCAVVQTLRASG